MQKWLTLAAWIIGLIGTGCLPSLASSLAPISDAEHVRGAGAVFSGEVLRNVCLTHPATGRLSTKTWVKVDEIIKGELPSVAVLVHRGGSLKNKAEINGWTPRLEPGERRLFLVEKDRDGTFFACRGKASAIPLAARQEWSSRLIMARFRRAAFEASTDGEILLTRASSGLPDGGVTASGLLEKTLTPGPQPSPFRFITGDRGEKIGYRVDLETLPPGLSHAEALQAVANAFDAWSMATGLAFEFEDEEDFGRSAADLDMARHCIRVQCHDRYQAIPNSTVLGIGGTQTVSGGFPAGYGGRVFEREFHRAIGGYVVLNHRHPSMSKAKTFEEVLCHEIGHVLGFAHSSETEPEPDDRLAEAIMYYKSHQDGRGAALGENDLQVAAKAYPHGATPPVLWPDVLDAVSFPEDQTAHPDFNVVSLMIGHRQSSETLRVSLGTATTSTNGTFILSGQKLTYSPHPLADLPVSQDLRSGHDQAVLRVDDGVHSSPWERITVRSISPDRFPKESMDGLPDAWMERHFGNVRPEAGRSGASDDPDADGCDNLTEFIQGTAPNDPGDRLSAGFELESSSILESHGLLRVPIRLSTPPRRNLRIPVAMSGSARGGGTDYLARSPDAVLVPAGTTKAWIEIELVDDDRLEDEESLTLSLRPPEHGCLHEPVQHIVTIVDDQAPVRYDFGMAAYEVVEGDENHTIPGLMLKRSGNLLVASSVKVLPLEGEGEHPARAGVDFAPEPITVAFAAGETERSIPLTVLGDDVAEADEVLKLTLGDFGPYAEAGRDRPTANLTISDDDTFPRLTISEGTANEAAGEVSFKWTLSSISLSMAEVTYETFPSTAMPDEDYHPVRGKLVLPPQTGQGWIRVPIVNDTLDEDDEVFTLALSQPVNVHLASQTPVAGTILDNDASPQVRVFGAAGDENSGSLPVMVRLSTPSGRETRVGYTTEDRSAVAGEDYEATSGILHIPPGIQFRIIDIRIRQDGEEEGTETFVVRLFDPEGAVLGLEQATVTIEDAAAIPRITVAGGFAEETAEFIEFAVQLSFPPEAPLNLPYRFRDASAVAGKDYNFLEPTTLTFLPGQREATVSVEMIDDDLDEPEETFLFELLPPGQEAIDFQARILDDDPPPSLIVRSETLEVRESAGMAHIALALSAPSGKTVSLRYRVEADNAKSGEDFGDTEGVVIFDPLVTEAGLSIPIIDDSVLETDEKFHLRFFDGTSITSFPEMVAVTIQDDEEPAPLRVLPRDSEDPDSRPAIEWQGVQGRSYKLQRSSDLQRWSTFPGGGERIATGFIERFTDPHPPGKASFYRFIAPNF